MSQENDTRVIQVSADLYGRVQQRVSDAGFGSVDEYVAFVLEEILKDEEEEQQTFSKEEEEEVKKRLRALGYLE